MPGATTGGAWPTILAAAIGVVGGLGGASLNQVWSDIRSKVEEGKARDGLTKRIQVTLLQTEQIIDAAQREGDAKDDEVEIWIERLSGLAFSDAAAKLLYRDDLQTLMSAAAAFEAFGRRLRRAPDSIDKVSRAEEIRDAAALCLDPISKCARAFNVLKAI